MTIHYTLTDLTSLYDRLPGKMSDILFSQYLGYQISYFSNFFYLLSPFEDDATEYRKRGPHETKVQAWNDCPNWSFSGPLVIRQMKRICRPDTIRMRGDVTEDIVDGAYFERIVVKWWLHGVVYRGEAFDYGHAAMRCYLKYMMHQLKATGPLAPDKTERGI